MFKKVADGWIRTRVLWYGRRPIWQMRHNHCPEMIKWLLIKTGLAYLPKVTMFYMIGPTRRRRPANNKKIRSIFLTFSAFLWRFLRRFLWRPTLSIERQTKQLSLSFSVNVSLQVCSIQIFSSSLFGKCFFPECDRPRLIYFAPLSASSGSFNY